MRKKENIKYIIFDLDNTLIEHDFSNETEVLCNMMGIPYSKEFEEQFMYFMINYSDFFTDCKLTKKLYADMLTSKIPYLLEYGKDGTDLLKAISTNDTIVKRNDFKDLLRVVAESGYKILAFTDWFADEQSQKLKQLGYYEYFSKVYGWDNSFCKADVRSMDKILKKDKNNYLFIGDSLVHDIALANKVGIESIWYNEMGKKIRNKEEKKISPSYTVYRLESILSII